MAVILDRPRETRPVGVLTGRCESCRKDGRVLEPVILDGGNSDDSRPFEVCGSCQP